MIGTFYIIVDEKLGAWTVYPVKSARTANAAIEVQRALGRKIAMSVHQAQSKGAVEAIAEQVYPNYHHVEDVLQA